MDSSSPLTEALQAPGAPMSTSMRLAKEKMLKEAAKEKAAKAAQDAKEQEAKLEEAKLRDKAEAKRSGFVATEELKKPAPPTPAGSKPLQKAPKAGSFV